MDIPPPAETDVPASISAMESPNYVPQYASNHPEQEPAGPEEAVTSSPSYNNGYSNGQEGQHSNGQEGHYPPQPADYAAPSAQFSPPPPPPPPPAEPEQSSRFNSPTMTYQQHSSQPTSRPSSGLSGGGDRYGYSQTYQEQNQRQQQQQQQQQQQTPANKNSVVIKVGMVGDAQIGKTSLMVKYVEGSWDEDYIQTLGRQTIF